ncbi:MAG: concentrative nucleoside transporter, family, partial [Acidobacteriaceae bacterium]|nr:concentrative nucleoside transporter, family [Acidobacteriaceae bacterium]
MGRFTGLLGLVAILVLAWLLSTNRKAIRWRTAFWGLGLQWVFALLVLRFDAGERALAAAGDAVNRMLAYAFVGSGFVFGELGKQHSSYGLIIAFQVLPTIIFISAFFAVLYHLGIMQLVIKGMARLMQLTMRISGAESLNVAASIFMGQTEAPLSIRPFLPGATQSELMTVMTSGMAHVSGG